MPSFPLVVTKVDPPSHLSTSFRGGGSFEMVDIGNGWGKRRLTLLKLKLGRYKKRKQLRETKVYLLTYPSPKEGG